MTELEQSIKNYKQSKADRIAAELAATEPARESKIVRAMRRKLMRECEMCGVGGC